MGKNPKKSLYVLIVRSLGFTNTNNIDLIMIERRKK